MRNGRDGRGGVHGCGNRGETGAGVRPAGAAGRGHGGTGPCRVWAGRERGGTVAEKGQDRGVARRWGREGGVANSWIGPGPAVVMAMHKRDQ